MNSVKTPRGTELPLLDLKGQPYLKVPYRVMWFREDKALYSIETEFVRLEIDFAIAKAVVRDEAGRVLQTAHKQEHVKHFMDFVEKAESGAIGRALGFLGYGTQFAIADLDEKDRLADAPTNYASQHKAPAPPRIDEGIFEEEDTRSVNDPNDPGTFVFNLPKFKGKRLKDIPRKDLVSYLNYMNSPKAGPLSNDGKKLLEAASRFLGDRTEI